MLVEQASGKACDELKGVGAVVLILLACLWNADKNCDITMDGFLKAIDTDPTLYPRLYKLYKAQEEVFTMGAEAVKEEDSKKKESQP